MFFESLEGRAMFSVAALSNGLLAVTGTAGNDNIYINFAPGSKIAVYDSNKAIASFSASAVKKIQIDCLAGNDTAQMGFINVPATVNGGAGDDVLSGASGPNKIYGGDGKDRLVGGASADLLDAGAGDDQLSGGNGNDSLLGGAGADLLVAGAGNDLLDGGLGADRFRGELGTDTVTYASRTKPVIVDINGASTEKPDDGEVGEKDFVEADVENIIGGSGNDTLIGSALANSLSGGAGNDIIKGGAGNDVLDGGTGTDKLYGEAGDDKIYAKDTLKDSVDGGAGTDKVQKDAIDAVTTVEGTF